MPDDLRRFVVLEHHDRGVHWDFLVEDGPTLRTWAIDEPICAQEDLPARSLPPHRRVYLDYEGPISGDRGTVRQWCAGICQVRQWTEERVELEARGRQLVGLVTLRRVNEDPTRGWVFRLGKLS